MRALLLAVTTAPATTPPEESVTTPAILPVVETWPEELAGKKIVVKAKRKSTIMRTQGIQAKHEENTTPPPRQFTTGSAIPSRVVRDQTAPRCVNCILYSQAGGSFYHRCPTRT